MSDIGLCLNINYDRRGEIEISSSFQFPYRATKTRIAQSRKVANDIYRNQQEDWSSQLESRAVERTSVSAHRTSANVLVLDVHRHI